MDGQISTHRSRGTSLLAVTITLVLALAGVTLVTTVPPASASSYDVEVDTVASCGFDPTATASAPGGTMTPILEVTRYAHNPDEFSADEFRVSVILSLWDETTDPATKVGQLSTGVSPGPNGAYDLYVDETALFTPSGGFGFGDTALTGALALVPDREYRLDARVYDFPSGVTHTDTVGHCTASADSCNVHAPVVPDAVLGTAPTFRPMPEYLATWAPNDSSICRAIWVPEGPGSDFTAQGFELVGDEWALVSGYHSDASPDYCRVYRIDLITGSVADSAVVPSDDPLTTGVDEQDDGCHHGGGITRDGAGRIWLADTDSLFQLDDSFGVVRRIPLSGMKGSFVTEGAGDTLWIGEWRDDSQSLLRKFAIADLLTMPTAPPYSALTPDDAPFMRLPNGTQGATFHGGLWTSMSTSKKGNLAGGGGCHEFGPGVEEFDFDSQGQLWAVFEGGAKQFWDSDGDASRFFPVIAQFDPEALDGGGTCASSDHCDGGRFPDVTESHPFCEDITWLTDTQISNGYADGTFRPTKPVTRQALVAWLYTVTGHTETAPLCFGTPFSDVPASHVFCEQIAWGATEGIVGGYPDGTFRPTLDVSRQAFAAFLYRAAGKPEGEDPACSGPLGPFPDVAATHPFCGEIAWASREGLVTGYPDLTFRPGNPVTRQAAAAILHRFVV